MSIGLCLLWSVAIVADVLLVVGLVWWLWPMITVGADADDGSNLGA